MDENERGRTLDTIAPPTQELKSVVKAALTTIGVVLTYAGALALGTALVTGNVTGWIAIALLMVLGGAGVAVYKLDEEERTWFEEERLRIKSIRDRSKRNE